MAMLLMLPVARLLALPPQPAISLEYAVKATYLYKLAPFVNWPPGTFHSADEAPTVEVAAESTSAHPIEYQQLVAAMDTVVRAGYSHVGVADPRNLR